MKEDRDRETRWVSRRTHACFRGMKGDEEEQDEKRECEERKRVCECESECASERKCEWPQKEGERKKGLRQLSQQGKGGHTKEGREKTGVKATQK